MIDVNKALGIQKIYENERLLQKLQASVLEEVRHVIPGYACDYYLRTFDHEIEFELCKDLKDNVVGTDVHVSGTVFKTLVYERSLVVNTSTKIYEVRDIEGKNTFPVRVICPDVLAAPENGERIWGQLIALADDKVTLSETQSIYEFATIENENVVRFTGRIENVEEYSFEFEEIKVEYWDIKLETVIGELAIIVRKDVIKDPKKDLFISAEAVLSFDVGIGQREFDKKNEDYGYLYENAAFSNENSFGTGFYPSLRNAEKVLRDCAENGDFGRFSRTCAPEIKIQVEETVKQINNSEMANFLLAEIGNVQLSKQSLPIVECKDKSLLGNRAFKYSSGDREMAMCIKVNKYGFVSEIIIIPAFDCKTKDDPEIYALTVLEQGMEQGGSETLSIYLSDNCIYRSEHADFMTIGASRIMDHIVSVGEKLNEDNRFSYEVVPAKSVLLENEDLPIIYRGEWCLKEYRRGELVAYIFIQLDEDNRICNILLSRDGKYFKEFNEENNSEVSVEGGDEDIKSFLETFYGKDNTINIMRENDTPSEDTQAYIWKEADRFMKSFLGKSNYEVDDAVIEEDCIGYACARKGIRYAVYMYAYGKRKTVRLDADYCQRLKKYDLSRDRVILITYLHVESIQNEGGKITYRVGKYGDSKKEPELWKLDNVQGKDIILYYPREEVYTMGSRFMAAYNQQNLDLLKALFSTDVYINLPNGGKKLNDAVYGNLSKMWETKGRMRTAYIRFDDVVYSEVPYIDNCCYIGFSMSYNADKIENIKMRALDGRHRDLIITDEYPEDDELNRFPLLSKVDFLPKSDVARFSVRMEFSNGEIRRYNFSVDETDGEKDPVVDTIQKYIFTDKIFANGLVKEHIELPEGFGYRNYSQRGQGIVFVNGYAISTAELYFNSYPIEEFDYTKMTNVSIYPYNYDEDGCGVGRIGGMDPENPYYLLDRNTMIAKKLPDEYQNTQMFIEPFCGGYSEELIMVNPMGNIDLRYYHNRDGCAGMWGWINKDFEVVIPIQYIYALNFIQGKAIVCKGEWNKDENDRYWCENEQWGVIDTRGNEIVPCAYDELYEVEGTETLFFVHEGGWEKGHYSIYDSQKKRIILELDFNFDIGYMFNECFVANNRYLIFVDHQPREERDYIYAYDMKEKKYVAHKSEYTKRTFNGESKCVVNKDGVDIIVF